MEIGRVIGVTTLRGFRFVIREGMEKHVKRDEFITVKEFVTKKEILGMIKEITISNELLPDEFGRTPQLEDFILNEGEYPVPVVKILGYGEEDGMELPRYGINPGTTVHLADTSLLNRLLRQNTRDSGFLGTLSTREDIKVCVSLNELVSKHCAILAMTGAGKSYCVGVLIEELLKKHGSIVVFDPHGEYKDIEFDDAVVAVYGVETNNQLKIGVGSLRTSDFVNLIPDMTDPQRDLLDEVLSMASRFYEKYDFAIILNILTTLYGIKDKAETGTDIFPEDVLRGITKKVGLSTIGALSRRISRLNRMGIFEMHGTPLESIASGNQLTVIDLSDADERVSETIIATISRGIFEARKRYMKKSEGIKIKTPTFLIVEEAHNFAPRTMEDRTILSRYILRRIAREGRKFGVGLCIVSQRPNKLDADILSQCNTQIIMKIINPSDQEYIRQSVETVTEDVVKDLPSLSRGEAIITGIAIKFPVKVKIRERTTEVGGEDIDIIGSWNSE